MHNLNTQPSTQSEIIRWIVFFALLKTTIHLITNAFGSYGLFRDEYYYLACAEHLGWGYVDQPPLSIWILSVITTLIGKSLFAIRFFPALFSGASIFFMGMATYELGGKKLAVSIVCIAMIVSGIHGSYSTFYSMNVIELMLWSMALYMVVRILNTRTALYWIFLGVIIGLAALNKVSGTFLGIGVLAGLIIYERSWLKTRWPYLAGLIALLIFLPYILWNVSHDFAHLEFIHNASTKKYADMNPSIFWLNQILINNPVVLPFALAGIYYFITHQQHRTYAFLFIIFLVVASIYTLNGTSKPEYLASVFPILIIGGSLQFDKWTIHRKWMVWPTLVLLLLGLPVLPLAIPILPIETYISYSEFLGLKPENTEGKDLGELPQFYADMFGWEDKVSALAEAYHNLPAEDRKRCAIWADNYGKAGAIDYFSTKYEIPKSICPHNNYWLWGPRDYTGEVMLMLSNNPEEVKQHFESVEDVGVISSRYCMPYENNLHVYVCYNLKSPLRKIWPKVKAYI